MDIKRSENPGKSCVLFTWISPRYLPNTDNR